MLKSTVKVLARHFGIEIRRTNEAGWNIDPFLDQQSLFTDHHVTTIFDVGASIGQTTIKYRERFPDATIHCFEPFPESFVKLQHQFLNDPCVKPYQMAIADVVGERDLYANHFSLTNSLLPSDPRSGEYVSTQLTRNIAKVTVPTMTLDAFCSEHRIRHVDILKMDIQGGEHMALEGARTLLSEQAVQVIYSEIIIAPLYETQSPFYHLCELLAAYNYHIFGLYNMVHGGQSGLLWADAIFIPTARLMSNKNTS